MNYCVSRSDSLSIKFLVVCFSNKFLLVRKFVAFTYSLVESMLLGLVKGGISGSFIF